METERLLLPISVAAEILGVHQRTLRIYDKKGILVPGRNAGGRRRYSFQDLERGRLIRFLAGSLGINLAGIEIIIYLLKNAKIKESDYLKSIEEVAKIV
jgi:MerR family transcriptional regulator/heat shock protein HspR